MFGQKVTQMTQSLLCERPLEAALHDVIADALEGRARL
jgi:hypothetical protein